MGPLASDRRGQTVQDFAVGTSVFLLTVAFTFAFVPSIFTPFQSEVITGAGPQSDRVATNVTQDLSIEGRSNWLDGTETEEFFDDGTSPTDADELKNRFDLPFAAKINITVRPIDGGSPVDDPGGDPLTIGDTYRDRPAASVTRIVVVKGVDECDPTMGADGKACQLTVRVW